MCFIKYYFIFYYRNHQDILRVQVNIILGMSLANKIYLAFFFFHNNVFSIISVRYNINIHFYSTLAYSLKKSRYICTCLLIK